MKKANIFPAAAGSGLTGVIAPTDEEFVVLDADDDRFPPTNHPNFLACQSPLHLSIDGRGPCMTRWGLEQALEFSNFFTMIGKDFPVRANAFSLSFEKRTSSARCPQRIRCASPSSRRHTATAT